MATEKDFDIHAKMRFIGYYMSDDQFMRTETLYPQQAEELADFLHLTYETILENRYIEEDMRIVFCGNTVFILKGESGWLYGYYPKYNIARITNVRYVKPDVILMPNAYKRWFHPGNRFHLYKPKEL